MDRPCKPPAAGGGSRAGRLGCWDWVDVPVRGLRRGPVRRPPHWCPPMTAIWTFVIYYLILFAASYVIVEFGQNYFYDEATPGMGYKVALGALIMAAMLTWTRSDFATMFTS